MRFLRSIVALAVVVIAVPGALVWAARRRFGGASPLRGVPAPGDWSGSRIWSALTERLSEQTVADVVIRLALVAAWSAAAVFLVTIVAEAAHMVRHAGMHLPDVRGLGGAQRVARVVAAGLLVVMPAFSSPGRAVARGDATLTSLARSPGAALVEQPGPVGERPFAHAGGPRVVAFGAPRVGADAGHAGARPASSDAAPAAGSAYAVRSGDSVYGIASQVAGPDAAAVATYAERIIDLNLGRDMGLGERFTNAAFLDVGWVLDLPELIRRPAASPSAPTPPTAPTLDVSTAGGSIAEGSIEYTVERGETLWSIADEELGDPTRWPEVYAANEGRAFPDGRTFDDPDSIHPGWQLELPVPGAPASVSERAPDVPAEIAPADATPPADVPVVAGASVVEQAVPPPEAPIDVRLEPSGPLNEWIERTAPLPDPDADVPPISTTSSTSSSSSTSTSTSSSAAAPTVTSGIDVADTVGGGEPGGEVTAGGDVAPVPASLLSIRRAAMLSVGVLTLLAARRRTRLRQAEPRARLAEPTPEIAATERALRATDPGERMTRVDISVRAAALALVDHGRRVVAVLCAPDGAVDLIADGPATLPAPFVGTGTRWSVAATTPIELLAPRARRVGAPCPTLVQLGIDGDGRDVYVDLEALGAVEIGGSAGDADAIVAAIAVMLAGSALAEVTTMIAVGVPDDAFLGHRLHRTARDPAGAFELATRAIGATASATVSTFELRTRVTSGEMWEPAVVLVGAGVDAVRMPRHRATGLAVVSAAPIEGPSSRLAPAGDAWRLLPLDLVLHPIGVRPVELDALADLVDAAGAMPSIPDVDLTVVGTDEDDQPAAATDPAVAAVPDVLAVPRSATRPAIRRPEPPTPPAWHLLVRLMGPVSVVDRAGRPVEFERSKTRELVAWLVTHRDRATRSNARTALWEHDVRDATFANVVSEARRSLARLVEPPVGDEWVGRTMTDALPLHVGVVADADLIEHALRTARLQPPDQAIVTLSPAAEWVAGIPFEGTSYLWPDAEGLTSNLTLLATSVTAELAAHCLSVGDIDGVFRASGRGLRVLAGHEELIGLRMRAHARVGDLAGVRHEWESYERMITADPWSDGEPSPKLVDLRMHLLNPRR